LAVDEEGGFIDGDKILAIVGLHLLKQERLPSRKVVATAYSNGGLRKAFVASGGDVLYAKPGDRYVLETMLDTGSILRGEQSGHIIFPRKLHHRRPACSRFEAAETSQIRRSSLGRAG